MDDTRLVARVWVALKRELLRGKQCPHIMGCDV
jgi:hypothetical protein